MKTFAKSLTCISVFCLIFAFICGCEDTDDPGYQCLVPDFQATYPYSTEEIIFDSPNNIDLAATIYDVDHPSPGPGLVVVHGGGWTLGSRDIMETFCEYWAQRGFDIMNIE